MSIRDKIIRGYALALIISLSGTVTGLFVGDFYHKKALRTRQAAAEEKKFLTTLQLDIHYNRPTKQLSPYLQDPVSFQRESTAFLQRVNDIQALLTGYPTVEDSLIIAELQPLLAQYKLTVNEFSQAVQSFIENLEPLTTNPEKAAEAQDLLVKLAKGPEFVAFIEFPDKLSEFYQRAGEREEEAVLALAQAENLRIQIIIIGLGLSTLLAIVSAFHTSREISRPIQTLTQLSQQVTNESNFELSAVIETQDEVGMLAVAFNKLIRKVKELIQAQEEYIAQIEQGKIIAETANRAKSEFLSNMSHELRTPLNGILGYAQILKRDPNLTTSQAQGLDVIQNSGKHLLTLINDILDLSKIEAGKLELYLTEVYLPSFLKTLVGLITMRALEKDILLKYQPDPHLPIGIKADEKRLRQILLNLLGNAIKFTDKGQVMLNVQVININSEQVTIRFEVVDTGVGMATEQITRIFQPFEQVGDIKRRAEGTGLGLAITKQFVELMGGQLKVKSQVGQGSTFWFEGVFPLSIVSSKKQLEAPDQIVGYQGKKRTILVVDDKEENRLVLQGMLEPLGFQIVLGENGQQEVELTEKIKPDLILTDLVMPIKTGFEAVQEIRQLSEFEKLPIIAVSASIMDSDQHQSKMAGCDEFLAKPVDENKLLNLIGQYLQLNWVYERPETIDLENLSAMEIPPQADLTEFEDFIKRGSLSKVQRKANDLKNLDQTYRTFAEKVIQLADNFEIKKLIEFFTDCQTQLQTQLKIDSQDLEIPPVEEIEVLYELAMLGSMRRIQERATYLEELDQKYSPFCQKLKILAQEFKDEEIIALVEKCLHTESESRSTRLL
ncbi:MAG: ATP-binding protein [Cyanobacteria bacterium J06592_8]